jgi:anti-sigma regulatory factor (Ser/Thr protein kinase)
MGWGAGMGLPNMKKNSDTFTIESVAGEGTTIEMIINFP